MGKQWRQFQTLFSWAPKSLQMATAAMKLRRLLLGRNAVTNLDSILKSRDIPLPTKVHLVKAMFFPVVIYGCELKYKEGWALNAFKLLLNCSVGEDSWDTPWTARRSNQSTLKEINSEYSLEGLILKWQYFGHLMQRTDSLEKTLVLEKVEGRRKKGRQRMR